MSTPILLNNGEILEGPVIKEGVRGDVVWVVLDGKQWGSESVTDVSRRDFLKILGIGAVVASAGIWFPKDAEARQHSMTYEEKIVYQMKSNNDYLEDLLSITDDDLKAISEWQKNNYFWSGIVTGIAVGGFLGHTIVSTVPTYWCGPMSEIAKTVLGVVPFGTLGALFGGFAGASIGSPDSPSAKSIWSRLGNIGGENKIIDRVLISEEIKRVREENNVLLAKLKKSLPESR